MSGNNIVKVVCITSTSIAALCLTLAFKGDGIMLLGIFAAIFAVMTASRYPYQP